MSSLRFDVRVDSLRFTAAAPANYELDETQAYEHDRYNQLYQEECGNGSGQTTTCCICHIYHVVVIESGVRFVVEVASVVGHFKSIII